MEVRREQKREEMAERREAKGKVKDMRRWQKRGEERREGKERVMNRRGEVGERGMGDERVEQREGK